MWGFLNAASVPLLVAQYWKDQGQHIANLFVKEKKEWRVVNSWFCELHFANVQHASLHALIASLAEAVASAAPTGHGSTTSVSASSSTMATAAAATHPSAHAHDASSAASASSLVSPRAGEFAYVEPTHALDDDAKLVSTLVSYFAYPDQGTAMRGQKMAALPGTIWYVSRDASSIRPQEIKWTLERMNTLKAEQRLQARIKRAEGERERQRLLRIQQQQASVISLLKEQQDNLVLRVARDAGLQQRPPIPMELREHPLVEGYHVYLVVALYWRGVLENASDSGELSRTMVEQLRDVFGDNWPSATVADTVTAVHSAFSTSVEQADDAAQHEGDEQQQQREHVELADKRRHPALSGEPTLTAGPSVHVSRRTEGSTAREASSPADAGSGVPAPVPEPPPGRDDHTARRHTRKRRQTSSGAAAAAAASTEADATQEESADQQDNQQQHGEELDHEDSDGAGRDRQSRRSPSPSRRHVGAQFLRHTERATAGASRAPAMCVAPNCTRLVNSAVHKSYCVDCNRLRVQKVKQKRKYR